MKHYFTDCDYFDVEENLWRGDLGYEVDIAETEAESLAEAIQNALQYISYINNKEELQYLYDDNKEKENENFIMLSIFEGKWDEELEEWTFDNPHDRKDKIVYRIFNGSKEFADQYGIKANMYVHYESIGRLQD